ncbi:MAG: cupredoxin domain-containing protein [Dehalococcoidia bacterium]
MTRVTPFAGVALVVATLALMACSDGGEPGLPPTPVAPVDGTLTLRAFEWGFEPESIILQEGQEVRIEFKNDGELLHDFKIEPIEAEVLEPTSTGGLEADRDDLFIGVDSGDGGTLAFVPKQTGTFAFWCTINDHRGRGMEGTLIIE